MGNKEFKIYNPPGSILREQQNRMLEMLLWFDDFCKKNDLKYALCAGTCLGAVRHHGFIPWDDDVDVEMPISDYQRFMKLFSENEKYVLQSHNSDPYYTSPGVKIRDKFSHIEEHNMDTNYKFKGVFIDVFPLEKSPMIIQRLFLFWRWRMTRVADKEHLSFLQKLLLFFGKKLMFGLIPIVRLLTCWWPGNKLHFTPGVGFNDEVRYYEQIFPTVDLEFEGHLLPCPGKYDLYLKNMYGDYMTPPCADQIKLHAAKIEIWS